jgi:2-methylisocitrate lyase-like PEP mutase family enzyme
MKNTRAAFKQLHHQAEPLLIGNVWNAQSAKVFEKLRYKAIGTSSAAVAESLGYADGQAMSFDEYTFVINRILKSTSLPLSVDLESGYGDDASAIVKNIHALQKIGVAGINIEDSGIKNGKREIADAKWFADQLKAITKAINSGERLFINVRTDVFLLGLGNPVEESKRRIALYEEAGVDGLFFPCITEVDHIKAIVQSTTLPVNVMCMPTLPDFETLKNLGVKRISMGNFVNKETYQHLESTLTKIENAASFSPVFG